MSSVLPAASHAAALQVSPLSWEQLEALQPREDDLELQRRRRKGPTNAQATLRLFGRSES